MAKERSDAEETSSEAVKAALLISSADRSKIGKLKDELANNYLLGTDQYPDTFEKALHILGNYQTMTNSLPYRPSPNNTGVVFLQPGGRGGRGAGRGGQGRGDDKSGSMGGGANGDDVSMMTGCTGRGESNTTARVNHTASTADRLAIGHTRLNHKSERFFVRAKPGKLGTTT